MGEEPLSVRWRPKSLSPQGGQGLIEKARGRTDAAAPQPGLETLIGGGKKTSRTAELDHILRYSENPAELKAAAEEWKQRTGAKFHSGIEGYRGDYARMARDNKQANLTDKARAVAEKIDQLGTEREIVDALQGLDGPTLRKVGDEVGVKFPSGMKDPATMSQHIAHSMAIYGDGPAKPDVQGGQGAHEQAQADIRTIVGGILGGRTAHDSEWVNIADVREELDRRGYGRPAQDAALRELEQQPDVSIVPQANEKALSDRTRQAAVNIGLQDKHFITIVPAEPAPRSRGSIRNLEDHTLTNLERLSDNKQPTTTDLRKAMPDISAADLNHTLGQLQRKGYINQHGDTIKVTSLGLNRLRQPEAFDKARRQFPRMGNNVPRDGGAAGDTLNTVTQAVAGAHSPAEIEARIKGLGLTEQIMRRLAHDLGITLPADLTGPEAIQRLITRRFAQIAGFRSETLNPEVRDRVLAMATRAAGQDITPGHDELHHYWTRDPEGMARWVESPHPWQTLVDNLVIEVKHKPLEVLKKWASRWFIEVFGFAAGSDLNRVTHGRPPRGKLVGPG